MNIETKRLLYSKWLWGGISLIGIILIVALLQTRLAAQTEPGEANNIFLSLIRYGSSAGSAHNGAGHSPSETETHAGHGEGEAGKHSEHQAVEGLFMDHWAGHRAVKDGIWGDPNTWHNKTVPTEDSYVLIPSDIRVVYSSHVQQPPIDRLKIDGTLHFEGSRTTKLIVDTIIVNKSGKLEIGSEQSPITGSATILFADNGPLKIHQDGTYLTRGLISMGEVTIHGQKKDSFVRVAKDPWKGSTTLTLAKAPVGWQVGDKLVVAGTHKRGWDGPPNEDLINLSSRDGDKKGAAWTDTEDEEVFITGIIGKVVTIDRPLKYDHNTPKPELKTYVANLTRNVTFGNEAGLDTPVHERGHTMFMSRNTDIRYAAFVGLGRTDKSIPSVAISDMDQVEQKTKDTKNWNMLPELDKCRAKKADCNAQGRYPIHLHRIGSAGEYGPSEDDMQNPVYIVGNAVDHSAGWGIVQHSTNAHFVDNAVYDVFGASFVAEAANDTGNWLRNIAIKSPGNGQYGAVAMQRSAESMDSGRGGHGFFFVSRLVEASENVAANTTTGYGYHAGSNPDGKPSAIALWHRTFPEEAYYSQKDASFKPTLSEFRDNEAFGNNRGFQVTRVTSTQNSRVFSQLSGFTAWEVFTGIAGRYSPFYSWRDVYLHGTDTSHPFYEKDYQRYVNEGDPDYLAEGSTGIEIGRKTFDWAFNNVTVENFNRGVDVRAHNEGANSDTRVNMHFVDIKFNNIEGDTFYGINADGHHFHSSSDLVPNRLFVQYDYDKIAPAIYPWGLHWTGSMRFLPVSVHIPGLHVDSIGATFREREFDDLVGLWHSNRDAMMESEGYYRLPSGEVIVLMEDVASDRATGEMFKSLVPVKIGPEKEDELDPRWKDHGVIILGGPAPIANGDAFRVDVNGSTVVDLINNDSDPDGGKVWLDGQVGAQHGRLFVVDERRVRYEPDLHFSGTDSFVYWVRDEEGNLTRGEVAVRVGSGPIPQPRVIDWAESADYSYLRQINYRPVAYQQFPKKEIGTQRYVLDLNNAGLDYNGDQLFGTQFVRYGNVSADVNWDLNTQGELIASFPSGRACSGGYIMLSDGVLGSEDAHRIQLDNKGDDPIKCDGNTPIVQIDGGKTNEPFFTDFRVKIEDAASGSYITRLMDGRTLAQADYGNRGIRFVTESEIPQVKSVAYIVNGEAKGVVNGAPFTSKPFNLPPGTHIIISKGYTEANGGGHLIFATRSRLTITADPTPPIDIVDGEIYTIQNRGSSLCVGHEAAANPGNGTNVELWACDGFIEAQQWRFEATDGGYYNLINMATGKALDTTTPADAEGANIQLWGRQSGNDRQEWGLRRDGDGYYNLGLRYGSWRYMTAEGYDDESNIAIHTAKAGGDDTQEWYIKPVYAKPVGPTTRYLRFVATSEINGNPWSSAKELYLLDGYGQKLDRSGWTITTDSEEGSDHSATKAFDGNLSSMWHTQWRGSSPPHPHYLSIDLGQAQQIGGFTYVGSGNGTVAGYEIYVSDDGVNWGAPVEKGTLPSFDGAKTVKFNSTTSAPPTPTATPTPIGSTAQMHVDAIDYNQAIRVDDTGKITYNVNGSWNDLFGGLKTVSYGIDGSVWGTGPDPENLVFRRASVSTTTKWQNPPGDVRLKQIDALDFNRAVGLDANGDIFYFDGSSWSQIQGGLAHVSIGVDGSIWGVNQNRQIFRKASVSASWQTVQGELVQIDALDYNNMVGVNQFGAAYRYDNGSWKTIKRENMQHVSMGVDGSVWGVETNNNVFRQPGESGSPSTPTPTLPAPTATPTSQSGVGGIESGQVYTIKGKIQGNCLDLPGSSARNGNSLILYQCTNNPNQQWRFEDAGDGYFRISSMVNTNMVVDAEAPVAAGSDVHLWTWSNNDNQKWKPVPMGDGSYQFILKQGGFAFHRSSGGNAEIYNRRQDWPDSQHWIIEPVTTGGTTPPTSTPAPTATPLPPTPTATPPAPTATPLAPTATPRPPTATPTPTSQSGVVGIESGQVYTIKGKIQGKCLDLPGSSARNGNSLILYQCTNNPNQQWRFEDAGDGYFRISSMVNTNTVVDAEAPVAAGSDVHLWTWSNNDNQKWKPVPMGDGSYQLILKQGGFAFHRSSGDNVEIYNRRQDWPDSQHWIIEPVTTGGTTPPTSTPVPTATPLPPTPTATPRSPTATPVPTIPDGEYRYVRFVAKSEIRGNAWASAVEVNLLDANGQRINRSGWSISASSAENDFPATKLLDGNLNTMWHTPWKNSTPNYPHELIIDLGRPQPVGGFVYTPHPSGGNGTVADYEIYVSNDPNSWGTAQTSGRFASNGDEKTVTWPVSGQVYTIKGKTHGKCLDVPPPANQNGTSIHFWDCAAGLNRQEWRFEDAGNGYFRITTVASGKVLDASAPQAAADVHLWEWNNTSNQKWKPVPMGDGSFQLILAEGGFALHGSGDASFNGANAEIYHSKTWWLDSQHWLIEPVR